MQRHPPLLEPVYGALLSPNVHPTGLKLNQTQPYPDNQPDRADFHCQSFMLRKRTGGQAGLKVFQSLPQATLRPSAATLAG